MLERNPIEKKSYIKKYSVPELDIFYLLKSIWICKKKIKFYMHRTHKYKNQGKIKNTTIWKLGQIVDDSFSMYKEYMGKDHEWSHLC